MAAKSSSPRAKKQRVEDVDTQHDVVSNGQQTLASEPKKEKTMSEDQVSIIEYASDLSDAEAPVPLPPGDYPATIRGAEMKTSGKGNKYINVTFNIDPDSYPADFTEGDADGTVLTFGRLSPDDTTRARWGMKKFLQSIGAPTGKAVDLNEWVGLSATVEVKHDTWEGETRPQIAKVKEA